MFHVYINSGHVDPPAKQAIIIATREKLIDEWKKRGVNEQKECLILAAEI